MHKKDSCDCGIQEFRDKVCYECGYDIEYGTEVVKNGKIYHKKCLIQEEQADAEMEMLKIEEQNHQAELEDEYYRQQEENSRTPQ